MLHPNLIPIGVALCFDMAVPQRGNSNSPQANASQRSKKTNAYNVAMY
jgi:hypothetical protein